MGVPDAGHRARLGVGLLRAGLGRLVVLGPVENASFMPWLAGTALLHSLAVTEQRAGFKAWTLLLSICAFSLCLLGTFLVRSGVLVSVHAFASDPARGMFILAFMVLVTGGSLLLFAVRGHRVRSRVNNALWSRESLLLGNNVLLMAAMLVVLLGTLLPLVHKQLGLGSISVGEPFFNTMFTWLMVPLPCCWGWGRWCAGAGTGRVTSGRCCSPPWSPPWCCRYCCHGCWKIKSSP